MLRMKLLIMGVIFLVLSCCGSFIKKQTKQKTKGPAPSAEAQERSYTLSLLMDGVHLTFVLSCIRINDVYNQPKMVYWYSTRSKGSIQKISWTKFIRHLIQGKISTFNFLKLRSFSRQPEKVSTRTFSQQACIYETQMGRTWALNPFWSYMGPI